MPVELTGQELDRLPLEPVAPLALDGEDLVGQAPYEPWLRNVTSGSSAQWRASGDGILE
jgi:hypothetical protein